MFPEPTTVGSAEVLKKNTKSRVTHHSEKRQKRSEFVRVFAICCSDPRMSLEISSILQIDNCDLASQQDDLHIDTFPYTVSINIHITYSQNPQILFARLSILQYFWFPTH